MEKEPTTSSAQRRAFGTVAIVSIVIVVLALWAGWYIFSRGGNDADERKVYETIMGYERHHQLDLLEEALDDYLDTYNADAYHYSQLKALSDRFQSERADWLSLAEPTSVDAVLQFIDAHPDGFYRAEADHMLDSLSFAAAEEENTREAYEHYMEQFSAGAYLAKAQKNIEAIDHRNLSDEETAAVKAVLRKHFEAMGDNNRAALLGTLAASINSYIGKADPTEEDILAYMSHIHASGRVLVFTVANPQVTKVEAADQLVYNVQFVLKEAVYSHSLSADPEADEAGDGVKPEPLETKSFTGAAVLNESMRITSLVLKQ